MEDNLAKFLTTGVLGSLARGMSLAQVERVLGPPDPGFVIRDRKTREPALWQYGSLVVCFSDGIVDGIIVETYGETKDLPAAVEIDDMLMDLAEFQKYLELTGISCRVDDARANIQIELVTGVDNTVTTVFDLDSHRLLSISSSQYRLHGSLLSPEEARAKGILPVSGRPAGDETG